MQMIGCHYHDGFGHVFHKDEIPDIERAYDRDHDSRRARYGSDLVRHGAELDSIENEIKEIGHSEAFRALKDATTWVAIAELLVKYNLRREPADDPHKFVDWVRESWTVPPPGGTLDAVLRQFTLAKEGERLRVLLQRRSALRGQCETDRDAVQRLGRVVTQTDKLAAMLPRYKSRVYSVRELHWLAEDFRQWVAYMTGERRNGARQSKVFASHLAPMIDVPDLAELDRFIQSGLAVVPRRWRNWKLHEYPLTNVDSAIEAHLREIFADHGFSVRQYPDVLVSKEIVVEMRLLGDQKRLFDILGVYRPRQRQIILYDRMIRYVSDGLNVGFDELKTVVLAHELGHWIAHQLPHPLADRWRGSFSRTAVGVREGHAQLFCWWAIRDRPELDHVFCALGANQSAEYRVFLNYVNDSPNVVLWHLLRMRGLRRGATLEDWGHVLPSHL